MRKLIAACLLLAAASLLLPSEPSYDPLAWLIWGRELAHFQLDTSGGPSWKPLPVFVTALLAPYRVVFRSSRELIAGRVKVLGHARQRVKLARVGSILVYRREGVTFPQAEHQQATIGSSFTRPLQGIHTRTKDERNTGPGW
jgi:hypothetical protein